MNPLLWALVTGLIPSLLSLIAYLIVASQHKSQLKCPGCRGVVEQDFHSCPHCGYHLQDVCPHCNKALAPDWKLCPQCGRNLQE